MFSTFPIHKKITLNHLVYLTEAFATSRWEAEPGCFLVTLATLWPLRLSSIHFSLEFWHIPKLCAPKETTPHCHWTCKFPRKHWHVDSRIHSVLCLLKRYPQDAKKTNAFFSSKLFLLQMLSISIWEAFNISSSYRWSVGGLAKYQLSP